MKRSIPTYALLFTSTSAILGSGWLFSAYYTSRLAGPAAIFSWIIGAFLTLVIAFVFAEISALIPITGSSTRIPQYTHGTIVSFTFSWIIWLAWASLVPIETQAILQYLDFYFPFLTHQGGGLTGIGYLVAGTLMLALSILNIFSLRWVIRSNSILTVIKITIPVVIAIIILIFYHSPQRIFQSSYADFNPYGFHGVFSAITMGGIIFAFNGFKQACEMAGEAKNPHRALPIAVIGSIVICLFVYLLMQFAFLTSLKPENLTRGWTHLLLFAGSSGPIASILTQDKLTPLQPLLYIGAILAPLGAALVYVSSASRSLYGMGMNKQIPDLFKKVNSQGIPIIAILTNFIFGMLLYIPLHGWKAMATFLTSLMACTYVIAPVSLLALRTQLPEQDRPFQLPFVGIWSTLAFYICTLLVYWSGWVIVYSLTITIAIGILVFFIHYYFINPKDKPPIYLRQSTWIWPYFTGIVIISYFGNYGGIKKIPFGWDFLVIGIFCIFIMWLAMKFKLPATVTQAYINKLEQQELIHEPTEQP